MKLIIFGANGGLGQWTWKAAVDGGHDVLAFVRTPSKLDQADPRYASLEVVQGDVMDAEAVRAACAGCRVAINGTSPAGGTATADMARSIVENGSAAGVEAFYMVGGMGALWAPGTDRKVLLQDWSDAEAMQRYGLPPNMPREMIRKMTAGHLASMAILAEAGVPHTYLCPGAMKDGPATTDRVVTLDELGGRGAMRVSFGNVAKTIVDDLERGALLGHRVCVSDA
jgi:putative NADH-flavin reductase